MKKRFNTALNRQAPIAHSNGKKLVAILCMASIIFAQCKKAALPNEEAAAETAQEQPSTPLKTNASGPDFTIAVIPDTQVYVETNHNVSGSHWLDYFTAQTQWIVDHKTSDNIAYVIHVGDIVNDGDSYTQPWQRADTAMDVLDPSAIPYGTAVGNHEQTPNGIPFSGSVNDGSTTVKYNQYMGVSRVGTKPWYGGSYAANNNDSHYDLFSAGGLNFIAIYIEYDAQLMDNTNLANWAYNLLVTYASRKAIIVTHYVGSPATPTVFGAQTAAIYNKIKSRPNVFLFVGGHVNGEGYRQDTYSGRTIKSYISDYQFRTNGGDGYMRLMKFSTNNDLISIKTYSPYRQNHGLTPYFETDSDSEFIKPLFHEPTTTRTCDFDNNGKSQPAFFNAGVWKMSGLSNVTYGASGDIPAPADYTGDGKTDLCYFRPSNGIWYSQSTPDHDFGISGDIPVPGDYDGDGKAEFAVYRPSTGFWYIYGIAPNGLDYGDATDIPVPGDYDGDGKVDLAIYRPSDHTWHLRNIRVDTFGANGDIPVPGDYNGDGEIDIAMFRPSTGTWLIQGQTSVVFGQSGDIPAPGDYVGDGKTHQAVYRPSTGQFIIMNGATTTIGVSGDKLLNLPYHIRKFFFP